MWCGRTTAPRLLRPFFWMQEEHDRASEQPLLQRDTGDLQSNIARCKPPQHMGMSGARERDVTPAASPPTCAIRSRRTQLPSTVDRTLAPSGATTVECGGAPESGQGGDGRRRSKRAAVVVTVRVRVRRKPPLGWRPSPPHFRTSPGPRERLCAREVWAAGWPLTAATVEAATGVGVRVVHVPQRQGGAALHHLHRTATVATLRQERRRRRRRGAGEWSAQRRWLAACRPFGVRTRAEADGGAVAAHSDSVAHQGGTRHLRWYVCSHRTRARTHTHPSRWVRVGMTPFHRYRSRGVEYRATPKGSAMVSWLRDEVVARAGALAAAQWHVTLSGLEREATEQMEVLRRGNSERVHVMKRWRPHVTHVVATCNEQRLAKRTLKCAAPPACARSLQPCGPPPPHSP